MNENGTASDRFVALWEKIDQFSDDRDWGKYHTPKNLSMAMAVEVAELMEIFQWQEGIESYASLPESKKTAVAHEVADVFIYLLRFCSVTGIDPLIAVSEKLVLNDAKYPAEKVKGRSEKYSDY